MTTENPQEEQQQEEQKGQEQQEEKKGELYQALPEAKEDEPFDADQYVADLDQEAAARHEADDAIAPYELVSDPTHLKIAGEYHEDAQAIAAAHPELPAQAVESILHFVLGEHAAAVERDAHAALSPGQIPGYDLSNRQTCMTTLRRQFGDKADGIVQDAVAAFKALPPDVQAYLDRDDGSGQLLTNSPALLTALALHRAGYTQMNRAQAEKEVQRLRSQTTLDALGKAQLAIARHVASRGKTNEDAKLLKALTAKDRAKPTPTAAGKIRGDINVLRRSKAYGDKDHPGHAETVRQVNALYRQLHGDK